MARYRSGQTLIEGIIAIAVVTVGLMGVIGLAIGNQASAQAIGDRAVATVLAREGLEVAKSIRDSNWLAGNTFGVGLLSGTAAVPTSNFAAAAPTWSLAFDPSYADFSADATRVTWLSGDRRYGQQLDGGDATKFRRRLELSALCRPAGATGLSFSYDASGDVACSSGELIGVRVRSFVQWPQGPGLRTVALELRLFDWR